MTTEKEMFAPESGKCCGECGLCMLCEQATLYTKAKKLYNSSKNPLSFLIKSNVDMSAKTKGDKGKTV